MARGLVLSALLLALAVLALAADAPKATATTTGSAPAQTEKPKGKRILLWTFAFATSHHMVFSKIGRELVARGHEVTMVRTNIDSAHIDYTGLKVFNVQLNQSLVEAKQENYEIGQMDPLTGLVRVTEFVAAQCPSYHTAAMRELYESSDLVLIDSNYGCACIFAGLWKTKARVDIAPAAFVDPFSTVPYGVPASPFSVPQTGPPKPAKMNFGQRVENFVVYLFGVYMRYGIVEPVFQKIVSELGYGDNFKIYSTFDNVDMMLYPATFAFQYPRLLPPNAKLIGPVLPEPAKPIADPELKAFIDKAKNGFVLLSFGTNVQPSTAQTQRLLKATHALQMPVIWKTNGVDVQSSDLLLVRSWIPQNDLLGHPKCRMFISHGGINGVLEAAYHGVPMAGFPMYADQFLNIATAEYRGMAKYIDKDTATDAELEATFRALLTDKTFAANAKEISSRIRDTPRTPTQEGADWVEYVAKHGGEHLRLADVDSPALVRAGVDVVLFLIVVLVVVLAMFFACVRCAFSKVCGSAKKKVE